MRFKSNAQRKAVMSKLRFYNKSRYIEPKYEKKLSAKNDYSPVSSRELELYTENDAQLYEQQRRPLEKNFEKKMKNGTYDSDKATVGYYHIVDNASKKYSKEFGDTHFTKAEKLDAARKMRMSFEAEHRQS